LHKKIGHLARVKNGDRRQHKYGNQPKQCSTNLAHHANHSCAVNMTNQYNDGNPMLINKHRDVKIFPNTAEHTIDSIFRTLNMCYNLTYS
jgi:hypothetical protein